MKRTTTDNKVRNKIRAILMVVLMCASMFALSSCGTNEIIGKDFEDIVGNYESLPAEHDKSRMNVADKDSLKESLWSKNNVATTLCVDEQYMVTNIDGSGDGETLMYYVDGDEYVLQIGGEEILRETLSENMTIDDYVIEMPGNGGAVFIVTKHDGADAVSEVLYYLGGTIDKSLTEVFKGSVMGGNVQINEDRCQVYFAGSKYMLDGGVKREFREVSDVFLLTYSNRYNVDDDINGRKYVEVFPPRTDDADAQVRAQYREAFKECYDLISDQRWVYFIDIGNNGTYECIVDGLFDTHGSVFYMQDGEVKRYVSRYPGNMMYVFKNSPMFVDGSMLDESDGVPAGEIRKSQIYYYLTDAGLKEYGSYVGNPEGFNTMKYYIGDQEVDAHTFLANPDANSQGGYMMAGDYDYDYAPVYRRVGDSLEADTAEGRVPASEMASPFDSQSSEGTGSSGEPAGLDALRERVAKEYESDWGMYSLTANEDLSIMYDWHMAGSYEGGTYYKVTDSGFELITEWVYDSIEDCYTIDDRSATQDEVNRLNEEMNASVYNLQ